MMKSSVIKITVRKSSLFLLWFVLVFLGFPSLCEASRGFLNTQELGFQDLVQKYPKEPVVMLNKQEHLVVSYKKSQLVIDLEVTEDLLYLDKTASLYHRGGVYYGAFTSIKEIEAYSLIPKNKKPERFTKRRVKEYQKTSVNAAGVFYDDQKELSFDYKGLVKGAQTHLSYTQNISDPKFLGRNFFSHVTPTLRSVISIEVPKNVSIGFNLINVDSTLVKYSKVKKGKNTIHTWEGHDLNACEVFDDGEEISHCAPHVIIYFKSVQHRDRVENILPDTKALYDWYYSMIKDVNTSTNVELEAITDSIVRGSKTVEQRAKAIYYWVQDHIKYVAFEDGMGGFIPRDAGLVCQRRYGDCKDMSSILVEMLKYAEIDASLTWIGTRDLPYSYSELHTPSIDNHMIASFNHQNTTIFLDAVGAYTPYGFTTEMIQGKEALIGRGENNFEVKKVPVMKKERNLKKDAVECVYEGGLLKGTGNLIAKGYAKLDFVYALINLNEQKKKEKLMALLSKGNNKFLVQQASFRGLKERDADLNLSYQFSIGNYVNAFEQELYVNLHLDKMLRGKEVDLQIRKESALKFDHAVLDSLSVNFLVPKGYMLTHLPPDVSFETSDFGFDVKYEKGDGHVSLKVSYFNQLLSLDSSKFAQWNKMVKLITMAYQENLVLKKI